MFTLNCRQQLLVIDRPIVMGVINTTPDSFYNGSRQQEAELIMSTAAKMLNDGATILDIGGQSTRPGSERLTATEEMLRVLPAIEAIHQQFPSAILSIDTFYSSVAKEAIAKGAAMVNDISAGTIDSDMIRTVADLQVPYVLMHMQGEPQSMQKAPHYDNVAREVLDFMIRKTEVLQRAGIHDLVIDPGFGFGKTIAHNFELLRQLEIFSVCNAALLCGLSRKSTIWKILHTDAGGALNGTTVLNTIALSKGANILRVHDVKEAVEAIELTGRVIK